MPSNLSRKASLEDLISISHHDPQRIAILGGTVFTGEFSEICWPGRSADSKFLSTNVITCLWRLRRDFGLQGPCYSIGAPQAAMRSCSRPSSCSAMSSTVPWSSGTSSRWYR